MMRVKRRKKEKAGVDAKPGFVDHPHCR